MQTLWNDRWARIAALLIVVGGAIALAFEVLPVATGVLRMIGLQWTALLVVGFFLGAILLLFPGWWPLWRARRNGLSNAWVFALVSWGFATASLQTILILVILPVMGFNVFFVPQLQDDGVLSPETGRALRYASEYWWLAFPVLQVFATLWVTRWLARRWPPIDRAMGAA